MTGDPTKRAGEEEMHGARRRGEKAPSNWFDRHNADLSLQEKAEGEGGQEDPTATNITIRDGDACFAGGEGDECWDGNGNGDGSDDGDGGDIGRKGDVDGSDGRPDTSPAPPPCGLCVRARGG